MQSCSIDLQQRLFRCSHRKKHLSVKLGKNSRKNIWSVKVGVHQKGLLVSFVKSALVSVTRIVAATLFILISLLNAM